MLRRYKKLYENEYISLERLVKYICSDKDLFAKNFEALDLAVIDYGDDFGYYMYHSAPNSGNLRDSIIDVLQNFRKENKPICDGYFSCYFIYLREIDFYPDLFTFYNESEMIEKIRQLYNKCEVWDMFEDCSQTIVNNIKKEIKGMSPEEIESFIDVESD